MKDLVLNAQKRENDEKLKEIRAQKMVPAIIYGKNKENISVKVNNSDLLRTYRVAGESHIVSINVDGKSVDVLFHDFQKNPITGDFLHVDFYAVTKGEKLTTNIPLVFVGNSEAVKNGALLEEHTKEIEVKVLPKDLVDSFEVDLALLKEAGSIIRVSDLNIDSSKFEVLNNSEDVVAMATEPKEQVIEETPAEAPAEEAKTEEK